MRQAMRWGVVAAATIAIVAAPMLAIAQSPVQDPGTNAPIVATVLASGQSLKHLYRPENTSRRVSAPLTGPDDITAMGSHLFVAFQNGVGPQGQASPSGNLDSTVVELTFAGAAVRQWDIVGHCDGLTADPAIHRVIATVNEDRYSSLYTIDPEASSQNAVQHYRYNEPLPHNGGTDAISIMGGRIFISASAPGTTGPAAPSPHYPALYEVRLDAKSRIASVHPAFFDEAHATEANVTSPGYGTSVQLALTDPDSNEVVPRTSARFGGDIVLDSQGDQQQIYIRDAGGPHQRLSVLDLSQSIGDSAWVTDASGTLYATDNTDDTVDAVRGGLLPGLVLVAVTPCDANGAPAACPGSGYAPNYLGALDPYTGTVQAIPVQGPLFEPQGLLFEPRRTRGR